jgi:hypothetical protein
MSQYQFWLPFVISILSAIFAYRANNYTHRHAKESFKNMLRSGLQNAKYKILELEEREYHNHQEKMLIIESISDNLMYQSYPEEKNNYLNDIQRSNLSNLQEEIETYLGLIMSNTDPKENKTLAISEIKKYLASL